MSPVDPFGSLPEETIAEILILASRSIASNKPVTQFAYPFEMCRVSRHWQSIAAHTPKLWTYTYHDSLVPLQATSVQLERSKTQPLNLITNQAFDGHEKPRHTAEQITRNMFAWLETVALHSSRWQSFQSSVSRHDLAGVILGNLPRILPALRRFYFCLSPQAEASEGDVQPFLISICAPLLAHCLLCGPPGFTISPLQVNWLPPLNLLRGLSLEMSLDALKIAALLPHTPQLTKLALFGPLKVQQDTLSSIPIVHTHLESLLVTDSQSACPPGGTLLVDFLDHLFRLMAAPSLSELLLSYTVSRSSYALLSGGGGVGYVDAWKRLGVMPFGAEITGSSTWHWPLPGLRRLQISPLSSPQETLQVLQKVEHTVKELELYPFNYNTKAFVRTDPELEVYHVPRPIGGSTPITDAVLGFLKGPAKPLFQRLEKLMVWDASLELLGEIIAERPLELRTAVLSRWVRADTAQCYARVCGAARRLDIFGNRNRAMGAAEVAAYICDMHM